MMRCCLLIVTAIAALWTAAPGSAQPSPGPAPTPSSPSSSVTMKLPFTPPAGWAVMNMTPFMAALLPTIELNWQAGPPPEVPSILIFSFPAGQSLDQTVAGLTKTASGVVQGGSVIHTMQCGVRAAQTDEPLTVNGRSSRTSIIYFIAQKRLYEIHMSDTENNTALPLVSSMCPGHFANVKPPPGWTALPTTVALHAFLVIINPASIGETLLYMSASLAGGGANDVTQTALLGANNAETKAGNFTVRTEGAMYCGLPGTRTTMTMNQSGSVTQVVTQNAVRAATYFMLGYARPAKKTESAQVQSALSSFCPAS